MNKIIVYCGVYGGREIIFEDCERSTFDLKVLFLRTLFYWMMVVYCGVYGGREIVFEDCERSTFDLKVLFLQTLFDWMMATGQLSFHTFLEFLDHCNFRN
jgi:hypothetical protein